MVEIIKTSSAIYKFDFIKTKSDSNSSPNFKVTLGVMPDYMFNGEGMRIDGISKGKTAEKHGFIKGDIVVKMGDVDVYDMQSYMIGLSKFEKGESTLVKVKRNDLILEIPIIFQ